MIAKKTKTNELSPGRILSYLKITCTDCGKLFVCAPCDIGRARRYCPKCRTKRIVKCIRER